MPIRGVPVIDVGHNPSQNRLHVSRRNFAPKRVAVKPRDYPRSDKLNDHPIADPAPEHGTSDGSGLLLGIYGDHILAYITECPALAHALRRWACSA